MTIRKSVDRTCWLMNKVQFLLIALALPVLLIGYSADAEDECSLAVAYILDHKDELEFGISIDRCIKDWKLKFEKFGGREKSGEPIWYVLDTFEVRKDSPDEVMVSQTCSIGGVEDEGIVVVALQTDEDWFSSIRLAWRVDRERGRWISVDSTSVRCWNEAAGT